jgi:signal transduction histidine kinase
MHSHKDTAVIMVSGIDRAQRALDAVRLGAFDYLIKPCDMDVLEISVERALERRDLLLSARRYKQDLEVRNVELARRQAELQRLQAQLVHSEKMASLGQLAAGVAHEINNPVGFIHGNLEMLEDCAAGLIELVDYYDSVAPQLPAPILEEVAKIKKRLDFEASLADLTSIISDSRGGTERIRDIVQNLRTFSRLDEAEFKKADIQEGIESTLRLLSRYYTAGHVQLTRDYAVLPPVDCYAGQLNQVWMNLLANAAQSIGTNAGEVRIATRLEDNHAVISISDTGSGIPDALLTKIFDPFFTTKPVGEGTGLGLSITFGIIERHNGTIEVTSAPGEWTTFTVRLPVNATPQPASETRAHAGIAAH